MSERSVQSRFSVLDYRLAGFPAGWKLFFFVIILQILSGMFVASAVTGLAPSWVVWFALAPFFLISIHGHPACAALSGAVWGGSLFAFLMLEERSFASSALVSGVLLTFVPAAYASVLAVVARHAGFNPVFAGLAWVGLELALRPLHLPLGLLTPTDVDPGIATSLTPLLGYAFVSFLVATANAYIAKKLLGLTARRDDRRIPPRPDPFRLVQPTDRRLVSHDAIRKGNARAPPQRKQRLVYIVAV